MSVPTESISLSSDEAKIPQLTSENQNKITAKLTQIKKWKKQGNVIQLLDKKILHITRFDGRKTSFWVSLLFLNKKWKRKFHIEWKWLILSVVLGVLCAGSHFTIEMMQLTLKFKYAASVTVILATLCVIFLATFFYKIQNSLVFYSRNSKMPLFELFHNSPNKAEYNRFLELVGVLTAKQYEKIILPPDKLLAAELAEIRRLKDSNIVTEKVYNQARQRLLSSH